MSGSKQAEMVKEATPNKGYEFEFKLEEHLISCFGSAWSGKEIVQLDGVLISEKRSMSRASGHKFNVGPKSCEIEFDMVNMLTTELHCRLIVDGVHVRTQKAQMSKFYRFESKQRWKLLLLFLLGGIIGGYIVGGFLFQTAA